MVAGAPLHTQGPAARDARDLLPARVSPVHRLCTTCVPPAYRPCTRPPPPGSYSAMVADSEVVKVLVEILTDLKLGRFEVKLNHR